MNGDSQIIYDKLIAMEKKQDERTEKQDKRHEDNLKVLGKLPCGAHSVKINLTYGLILIMVTGCVGGFWWLLRK